MKPERAEVSRREVLVGALVVLGAGCTVPALPSATSACVANGRAAEAPSPLTCRSRYCRYYRTGGSEHAGVCSGVPCV